MKTITVSPNEITRWDFAELEKQDKVALKVETYLIVSNDEKDQLVSSLRNEIGRFSSGDRLVMVVESKDGFRMAIPDAGVSVMTKDEYREAFPVETSEADFVD